MNRTIEHAAFAANLAKSAVALLDDRHTPVDDIASAYKHLLQARDEISTAIAHIQLRHPEAVLEAHRVTPREPRAPVADAVAAVASEYTHVAPSPAPSPAARAHLLAVNGVVRA